MIEINNLKFNYPKSDFRLRIDSLVINDNEKVAIVGPSGSGKTTLLNLIAGITATDRGEIRVDQFKVSELDDSARRNFRSSQIGMVFQQFELIEYLSVLENILLPFLVNQDMNLSRETRERAELAANSMGLGDKLRRTSRKLSQGEQQRVAICRALVNEPRLILADEPTGNLDPRNKRQSLDLLFEYCEKNSATLVVVTHDTTVLSGFDQIIDFESLCDHES